MNPNDITRIFLRILYPLAWLSFHLLNYLATLKGEVPPKILARRRALEFELGSLSGLEFLDGEIKAQNLLKLLDGNITPKELDRLIQLNQLIDSHHDKRKKEFKRLYGELLKTYKWKNYEQSAIDWRSPQ